MSSLTKKEIIKITGGLHEIDLSSRYGCVADGSTDCATGLMAMRSEIAGENKHMFRIYVPPASGGDGSMRYSNNKWLYNVQRLFLEGNGTTLRTIYSGSDNASGRTLFNGNMFQNNVLTYVGTSTWTTSYLINTVIGGSMTITCTTASQAANFAAGNRILLYGFDNTGAAYPPGCRSEWLTVQSINTTTGVITLTMPLQQSWNSAWWDDTPGMFGVGTFVGKPRIINLDRSGDDLKYCRHAEFNNVVFGRATGGLVGSGTLIFPSENTILNNCFAEDFMWPSESINMRMTNCEISELTEFDKLVKNVYCDNVRFRKEVTGGSNVENITVENSQCTQAFKAACSGHLIIRNTSLRSDTLPDTYTAPLSAQDSHNSMDRVTIERLKFYAGPSSISVACIDLSPFETLTIAAVSGTNIIIPFTGFESDANFAKVRRIKEGVTRMFKDDGSKGGTVTSLTFDETYNPTTRTGSITTLTNSPAVTGSGSSFTTQFSSGSFLTSGGVYIGTVLTVNSNTSMTLYSNSKSAVTAATYASAQGAFVITGDWSAPVAAEVWAWCYLKDIQDHGGHEIFNGDFLYDVATQRWQGNTKKEPPYEWHLNQDSFQYTGSRERVIPLNARIISIQAIVKKAYSGSDSTAKVQIYRNYGSFEELFTLNLKTVGYRKMDEFISYPATPISGDVYGTSVLGGWNKTVGIYGTGSGSGQAFSVWTASTKAYFDIIIEWMPF